MNMNILFADDDSERTLAPLARIIRAASGGSVTTAVTFVAAIEALRSARGAENTRIRSVLLDTILPYDGDGRGATMSDQGMALADQAAKLGVQTIAFLTVVRRDEVEDKFSQLQRNHPNVHWGYFDKTGLLAGTQLQNLIAFLLAEPDRQRTVS